MMTVIAVAFLPLSQGVALSPGSQPATERIAHSIKMKKHGYRAADTSKSCGTFKYRKGGSCVDARDKSAQ
jgi:hypothetical protein